MCRGRGGHIDAGGGGQHWWVDYGVVVVMVNIGGVSSMGVVHVVDAGGGGGQGWSLLLSMRTEEGEGMRT